MAVNINGTGSITGLSSISSPGISGVPVGSASAPAFSFTGDTNTGIYSPGADQVAVATNGTGRLFVDASGNVGVGTSVPNHKLHIHSTGNNPAYLRSTNDGTGTGTTDGIIIGMGDATNAYLWNYENGGIVFATNATQRAVITSAGLVGIGTSAPSNKLDVVGVTQVYDSRGTSGYDSLKFIGGSAADFPTIEAVSATSPLHFKTNSNVRMAITSAGLVGIGTSSVSAPLHVATTGAGIQEVQWLRNSQSVAADVGAALAFTGTATDYGLAKIGGAFAGSAITDGGYMALSTRAVTTGVLTERMRITAAGAVGIGTTSPAGILDIDVTGDQLVRFQTTAAMKTRLVTGNSDVSAIEFSDQAAYRAKIQVETSDAISFYTGGITTEAARLDSAGRLLIGTSAGSSVFDSVTPRLQVEGTSYNNSSASLFANTNDANGAYLIIGKSRGTSTGSSTIVNSNDAIGGLVFIGADGTDRNTPAARILAYVDSTPGANDMPGRLVFSTTADGASSPTERMTIYSDGTVEFKNSNAVYPGADNALSLGINGLRWSAVWAANGTIQTSDERAKADIADAALGSDFVKSLRPVSYKWIEGGKRDTGELDEDNNYVYESVPGARTHWGFIAQEVKQAVDATGVDFGGWLLTDKDDPDSQQALRYDQFIAPLTKALQETMAELEALKAEVAALKAQ